MPSSGFHGGWRHARSGVVTQFSRRGADPVSYTHLDVYKRQLLSQGVIAAVLLGLLLQHVLEAQTLDGQLVVEHEGCLLYTSRDSPACQPDLRPQVGKA